MELIAPYLASCLLLVVGGWAKARHPDAGSLAVSQVFPLHATAARRATRIVAVGEVALGLGGLAVLDRLVAGAVAAAYLALAAFGATVRRRSRGQAGCGCFGSTETPMSRLHVAVDVGLAGTAAAVATGAAVSAMPVTTVLWHQPLHGAALAVLGAVCGWLLLHTLSTLPRLMADARRARSVADELLRRHAAPVGS